MNTTRTQTGRDLKTEYIFRKRSTVALWNPSMQNRWNFLAGARVTLLRSSSQGLARGRQGYCCQWEAERRTGAFCRLFLSRLFARGFEVSEVQKNVRGASERFGGKRLGYTSLCGYSSPSPYSTLNEGAREFSIYSPRRVSVI